VDDPQSNVSRLLDACHHFRMHEALGTGPGFYYVWDGRDAPAGAPADAVEAGGAIAVARPTDRAGPTGTARANGPSEAAEVGRGTS
ncbi:MAG: hypothetical protein JSW68_09685, partial [Burkholderiales bacterium]